MKTHIALFLLIIIAADANARDEHWRVSVPLYLTAGAYYHSNGISSGSFNSVNASAELLLSSSARPFEAALFAEYSYSPDARQNGTTNIGVFVKHYYGNWDTTAYVFEHNAAEAARLWAYAGRIRYRFADHHKVGIEFLAPFDDASAPNLMLGYYATFSDALSIKFVVGSNVKASNHYVARTELVWQFN